MCGKNTAAHAIMQACASCSMCTTSVLLNILPVLSHAQGDKDCAIVGSQDKEAPPGPAVITGKRSLRHFNSFIEGLGEGEIEVNGKASQSQSRSFPK